MLPKLGAHKTESSGSLQSAVIPGLHHGWSPSSSLLAQISQHELQPHTPTLADSQQAVELKAISDSDVSALPLPLLGAGSSAMSLPARPSEQSPLSHLPQIPGRPAGLAASRALPHYAIPQDRTPFWSERDRLGRTAAPRNPYKQNLDTAPKLKASAGRLSSPARYSGAAGLQPASPIMRAPAVSPTRQRASHNVGQHLAPLHLHDVARLGSLKQASLLHSSHTVCFRPLP